MSEMTLGNRVLDRLWADRKQECAERRIQSSIVADGSVLRFLSEEAICQILGGAMDYGMAQAEKNAEGENRRIHVSLMKKRHFLFLQVEYFQPEQPDPLPNGLIRWVKKQGGAVTEVPDSPWTALSVLIPMP